LGVIDRELTQGPAAEAALAPQLSRLLGHGSNVGYYEALTRELCEALRSGHLNVATPGLLAMLRDDAQAKLAIDQPNYRHESSR
jgi:hypothetical protein